MTEYDYSPEAYEKYIANQTRVSNWVTDQSGRFKQYSNPFVGRSTSVPHSYSSHHTSRHGGRSSQPSSSSTSPVRERAYRPEPHRSFTAPVEGAYRSTSHGSRSHSSTSPTYRTQASSPTSHSTHTAHNYDPYKPKVKYQQYAYDSSAKQIVLPPPRHGERYIIVPPEGRELVVLNNDPYTAVRSTSGQTIHTTSSRKEAPLLKRLLTGFSAGSKNGSRHGSSGSSRRDRSRSY